eukprot:gene9456-19639_t
MLVTKKTIEKYGSSMNETAGSKISDFARKQLEKFGWSEGKGLGKNEDGMKKHIKIKKIEDNSGIGQEKAKQEASQEEWWHDPFDKALRKMQSKKKRRLSKSDGAVPNEPPTLEDLFQATGGARLGMRARADQQGKWARTETNTVVSLNVSETIGTNEIAIEAIALQETEEIVHLKKKKSKKSKKSKE